MAQSSLTLTSPNRWAYPLSMVSIGAIEYVSFQEWSEYDERAQQPVSILDIGYKFIKL